MRKHIHGLIMDQISTTQRIFNTLSILASNILFKKPVNINIAFLLFFGVANGQIPATISASGTWSTTSGGPGSVTFAPGSCYSVTVTAWGGGGGGGGASNNGASGGGAGGGYAQAIVSISGGGIYYYSVGAGGAAGTTAGTNGAAGGPTWFNGTAGTNNNTTGSFINAGGGSGGNGATSNAGAAAQTSAGTGTFGTSGLTAAVSYSGGTGGGGFVNGNGDGAGGGGGGAAGAGGNGGNGATTTTGAGGFCPNGGGGGGGGGGGATGAGANGNPGNSSGGGGSGGAANGGGAGGTGSGSANAASGGPGAAVGGGGGGGSGCCGCNGGGGGDGAAGSGSIGGGGGGGTGDGGSGTGGTGGAHGGGGGGSDGSSTANGGAGGDGYLTIQVVVASAPTATAGPPQAPVCPGTTSSIMNGSVSAGATATWSGGAGTWTSASDPINATYTPAPTEMGTITLTLIASNSCGADTVSETITINPAPPAPTVTSPVSYCINATATPLIATATGSLLWYTTATGGTGSSTAPTPSTATSGSTTYYVSQTQSGCESPRAAITVIVNPVPTATAGNTAPPCSNGSITLDASGGTSYSWSGPNGYSGTGSSPAPFSAAVYGAGTYTVTVTDANGCTATATTIVNAPAIATLEILPSDTTVLSGNPVQLNSVFGGYPASSITSYSWTPSTGLSCINCPNPVVSTASLTDSVNLYSLTILYNNGCTVTAMDTIKIEYEASMAVPTAFTPNSDGKNDLYMILATGVTSFYMTIYNRWGERVYESTDITQGWDGTYGGKPEPAEDYSAFIQINFVNGKTLNKTATVSLFR